MTQEANNCKFELSPITLIDKNNKQTVHRSNDTLPLYRHPVAHSSKGVEFA